MCHFRAQNDPFVLNNFFLVQTIIFTFIYLLVLFIVQNFKNCYSRSSVMRMCHFWAKNGPLAPNFFLKIINIILIYLLALFIVQKFKKILPVDPELWGCAIFGSKMAYFPKWEFFRKPVNESCFFHLCFSTCQKSKSNINVLVKYWRLKNAEILLAESIFWL